MNPKSLHDQIAFKCVHFTGVMQKTCKAGMVYDEVDKDLRIAYRMGLPCIKPSKPDEFDRLAGRAQCPCQHLRFPAPEEVQKELDAIERETQRFMIAEKAVRPIREKYKGQDWRGIIECPICKGKLHVTHSAYNGHVWGKCETEGCVAWIE